MTTKNISERGCGGYKDLEHFIAKHSKKDPSKKGKSPAPMSGFVELFGALPSDVDDFPLRDDSSSDAWMAAGTAEQRTDWCEKWEKKVLDARSALLPMNARDFAAVLAYESEGAKLDARLGWPSLGLWIEAWTSCTSDWPLSGSDLFAKLYELVESGASMQAFQALYPKALGIVLTFGTSVPRWDAVEMMLQKGWSPNAWNPQAFASSGAASFQALLASKSDLVSITAKVGQSGEPILSLEELKAGLTRLVVAATKAGFDMEARSLNGLTTLGLCNQERGTSIKDNADDPRLSVLIDYGADPCRISPFWISAYAKNPGIQKAMLARMEHSQIAKSVKVDGQPSARKPRI